MYEVNFSLKIAKTGENRRLSGKFLRNQFCASLNSSVKVDINSLYQYIFTHLLFAH